MKSDLPKCLHKVLGYPMLYYVVRAARECGSNEIGVVIGHKGELVRRAFEGERDICFVEQKEQKGTGHAVMMARDFIGQDDCDVMILFGDTPLVQGSVLKEMISSHRRQRNAVTVLSTKLDDPSGYGRILRDEQNRFLGSVEHKDADEDQLAIHEVNSGMYCFKSRALLEALGKIDNNNRQGEYYLPDTIRVLLDEGCKAEALMTWDVTVVKGVNNRQQLLESQMILRDRINRSHMENGVTFLDQQGILISPEVAIGRDTTLYPGVILEGKTRVGSGCTLGPNVYLADCEVESGAVLSNVTGRGLRFAADAGTESV